MVGLDTTRRVGPMGPGPSSSGTIGTPSVSARRSAPAQNVPPAPVSPATRADSSASNSSNAASSAAAVGPSTALRTSGRSIVTTVTGPVRDTRTVSIRPPPVVADSRVRAMRLVLAALVAALLPVPAAAAQAPAGVIAYERDGTVYVARP